MAYVFSADLELSNHAKQFLVVSYLKKGQLLLIIEQRHNRESYVYGVLRH